MVILSEAKDHAAADQQAEGAAPRTPRHPFTLFRAGSEHSEGSVLPA
jgi:hypothetical protein